MAEEYNTILEAFVNKFGAEECDIRAGCNYKQGGLYWEENTPDIQEGCRGSSRADYCCGMHRRNSFAKLPVT